MNFLFSGDTPTMYAAPSTNKTKPDIPKEVPHSPSSSGFTFFGVPLPSLNLNKLLGGQKSTAKKAEKSQVDIPIADRKVAIMNLPPYTRATTQGDGGFQPITDPMMIEDSFTEEYHTEISVATQKSSSSSFVPNYEQNIHKITKENSTVLLNEKKVDKQDAQYITMKPASQILPNTSEYPSSSTHFSKLEVAANENTSSLISTKFNVTSAPVKFSPNSEKSLVEEVTHTKDLVEEKNKFETTTEGRGLVKKDLESKFQSVVNSKKATSSIPPTLKTLPLSSTQIPDLITQKPKEGELTLDKIANVKNGSKKIEPVGSLSALLVPGGQQPHIRPAGRPKITKVQSPYTTETGILPSRENHVKNIKYSGDTVTLDPEITKLDEVKENWYFANYNKTYSEPYHGVVSKGATNIGSWGYYVVFYIVIGFNLGFRISFFI
ncbi:hypothetical protein HHI36_004233 [Cryptolaemus montrouzieri]|uniref:Uncharacterized protein n=1 Tax=Cryptolaemus montrouzieri TaxID=559131 RepID=A0ABD2NQW0_9CUCU